MAYLADDVMSDNKYLQHYNFAYSSSEMYR